jgi:DNA-binding transcriptional LysR family regulator
MQTTDQGAAAPAFDWDDARVVAALLQHRSFTAAGSALGVHAATVSRRLEALEAALGGRLFDRTPDGVAATALAERLAPHAEAMARAADGFLLAAQSREQKPEGEVRITAPPGPAEYLIAPALPRLLRRHPRLRVILDASVAYADLGRREADLALRTRRPTSGDLVARCLGRSGDGVFASRRAAAEVGTLRRLEQASWITWGEDLAHLPHAQAVLAHVPPERIALRTSHLGSQVAAARAGLGLLMLDRAMAATLDLVEVPLAPELRRTLPAPAQVELWLVTHRALREVPRVAAVWAFVLQETQRVGLTLPPER